MEKFKAYMLLVLNGLVWLLTFVVTLPVVLFYMLLQRMGVLSNKTGDCL